VTEQPVESIFARAWALLQNNWIIVVPGVVVGVVVGVLRALLTPASVVMYSANGTVVVGSAMAIAGAGLLLGFISLIGFIITQGMATAMAAAAWQRGTTTLADATAAMGKIVPTGLVLLLLAIVATILSIPTIGLAILAFYLFTLYTFPAAIIGNATGFNSVTESFRLTVARFVPTLIVAVLIFVLGLVGAIVGGLFRFVPFIGPIINGVLTQIVVGYAMLVIVGEYLNLRSSTPAQAYAAPPYTPAPPPYTAAPPPPVPPEPPPYVAPPPPVPPPPPNPPDSP
jgi:hypothetical protein